MDYLNRINIFKKFFFEYKKNNDKTNMNKMLNNIKNLHGKIIEYILNLKDSQENNKLEVLSDLEVINYNIITIINELNSNLNNDEIDYYIDDNYIKDDDVINDMDNNELDNILINNETNNVQVNKIIKLNDKLPSLILFYAEWCGYCKLLMPIWKQIEEIIPSDKINITKISCVENENLCKKIQIIDGYPTILLINDTIHKYSGDRSLNRIIEFINNKIGTNI